MTHGYWRLSRVGRETFPSPRIYFVSGWPKCNLHISEPSWLSLCSPLQRATDSISAPCRLPDSQAAREANALITACHMIGLARVLSNKALMSSFNCLRSAPSPPALPEPHRHARIHTCTHCDGGGEGGRVRLSRLKWRPSDTEFVFIAGEQTDHYRCHSNTLV